MTSPYVLNASTPAQVEELVVLLEQLSEVRRTGAAEGRKPTVDEIVDNPKRRQLIDYLYGLSDEVRQDLVALTLLGRGDFNHDYKRATETCARYSNSDDQVLFLMGKSVRLADYLRIGLQAVERNAKVEEQKL
jgi:Protein of unknown function (DUF3775)